MTITPMQMYWITRLDSVGALTCGITVICFVFALFTLGCIEVSTKPAKYVGAPLVILGALSLCLNAFIPTTKEMAAILIIPKIVNNEKVQGLPDKVMGLADAWIEDLKPENRPAK